MVRIFIIWFYLQELSKKQKITDLYEKQLGYNQAAPKNVGGMNITEIETDFCKLGVVWDRLCRRFNFNGNLAHIVPMFQEVEGKGVQTS